MKNTNKKSYATYGIIGMVGLFLMGAVAGYVLNGSDHINRSNMSKSDCNNIAGKIIDAARNNQPDLIAQLNKVYSENCLNRVFEEPKPQPKPEETKKPETTCEKIEMLLSNNLYNDESGYWKEHEDNAKIYQKLADNGCEENREKYLQLSQHEFDIAKALKYSGDITDENVRACEQIENLLTGKLYESSNIDSPAHIDNAKIYANLSERGCPENSEKYKQLAKQELEIARALNDDNLAHRRESIEIVETYKRLQMQAEAEKMIEKAKKLTNPAIDFIIQLQKIIEE